jgi:hypothetical protein
VELEQGIMIGVEPPGQAFSGNGLVEHATESHSIYGARLHTEADDAAAKLIQYDQDPVRLEQDGQASAGSKQTEVLERSDARRFLGIDLGINHARMTVLVTYRYHIRLYDTWKLRIGGGTLIVSAPEIRCGLPPAIHTDEIQETTARGWARGSPVELLEALRRDLTPVLSQYANDHRRLELVRDTCR